MNAKVEADRGTKAPPTLVHVGFRRIARVSPNGAQPIPAAALGFGAINSLQRQLDQQRNRGNRPNGNKGDGGGLPKWPADFIGHQYSDTESNRCSCQREQTIQWDLLHGFWNGYRERHRIPLYVSF
jgi:hypothetical protein